ncbi:O-antigen ligase family protein [Rossellomorea sp. DUT-2]|uniref:O-antigen ligase family protein n=1 Tax=Rossellomorea sp. DUT-2 TaxID=3412021 RepID=UPI003D16E159
MYLYILIFLTELYPVVNNLLNITYNSTVYRAISILTFVIIILLFLRDIIIKKTISKKLVMIILIAFILVSSILLSISIYGNVDSFAKTKYLTVVIRAVPMIFLASILVNKPKSWQLGKLKLINILISISLLKYLYLNKSSFFLAHTLNFGGVNYNDFSYIAALNIALSYVLLFDLYVNNTTRKAQQSILVLTSIVISYTALFFSGGRGAMVLSIVFLFLFIFNVVKQTKINIKKASKLVFIVSLLLVSVTFIVLNNETLKDGIFRGFSFLNFSGGGLIDWENTSGRLFIYRDSLELIQNSPFWGHGIGSVYLIHPSAHFSHNLFLDLFIDGGVFLIFFSIILIIYVLKKSIKNSCDIKYYFSLSLFLFSFINLLSGSNYLIEPILWFSLTYILLLNNKYEKEVIPAKAQL